MIGYKKSEAELKAECSVQEIAEAQNYLCGYRLCVEMLHLRRYERKRAASFDGPEDCQELLGGSEALWKLRMRQIHTLISNMKNGREKLILYYRYVRGESIESASNLIGISRRTAYRMHQRGLMIVALMRRAQKASEAKLENLFSPTHE